ncbi:DNA-damage-repair/toleration protein DRT111, chloroplastic [Balamuthia mandrillaris]
MFGLYSDLPAPKNSGGAAAASTPNSSANNNNTTSITASPKASSTSSTATSPAAAQQPSSCKLGRPFLLSSSSLFEDANMRLFFPFPPKTAAEAKSSPAVGWLGAGKDVSPSINALAQSVLLKKKRMQSMQSQTSRAHSAATIAAPSRNHSSAPTTPSSSSIAAPFPTSSITAAPTAPASTASSLPLIPQDIEDPYDPIRPNDYEECLKKRQRRQFRQQQQQHYDEEEDERRFGDSTYKETDRGGWSPPPSFEAAPPPFAPPEADAPPPQPQLNISGEEAYLRRARLSGQQAPAAAAPAAFAYSYGDEPATSAPAPAPATGGAEAGTVAERMMKKMGWNEGQGLGKRGDGIKKPLLHKKMNTGHSLIIAAEPPPKRSRTKDARTRVVLLRNMVGPGDVDEELAPETAEECTKFGKVRRCEIHEEKDPSVPPQKAVRIFVQFEDCDSAERARNNLNGRFFAKRVVEATYFDEERFEAGDLAAWPNED